MPNITDVDVFTDPVDFPGDGDAITSASVLSFAQDLANRTRYLKNLTKSAQYTLFGSNLAHNATVPITPDFVSAGFSVSFNRISVPANGVYLVTLSTLMVDNANTNTGHLFGFRVLHNAALVFSAAEERGRADISVVKHLSGSGLMRITDYATDTVSVTAGIVDGSSSGYGGLGDGGSKLTISFLHS